MPLIVILLFIYFTLPDLHIRLPAFATGVVGLSLNLGAYLSEVFRAAHAIRGLENYLRPTYLNLP